MHLQTGLVKQASLFKEKCVFIRHDSYLFSYLFIRLVSAEVLTLLLDKPLLMET